MGKIQVNEIWYGFCISGQIIATPHTISPQKVAKEGKSPFQLNLFPYGTAPAAMTTTACLVKSWAAKQTRLETPRFSCRILEGYYIRAECHCRSLSVNTSLCSVAVSHHHIISMRSQCPFVSPFANCS